MHQHSTHLLATPHGLTLAGVVLAKRNTDGSFAITGREKHIHAMISAAYGRPVPPQAIGYIRRGCELLAKASDAELQNAVYPFHPNPHSATHKGDDFPILARGRMMFALTGLNDMEERIEGKARMLKVQSSLRPDALLKSYGLPTWEELTKDASDDSDDEDEGDDSGDDSADDGRDNAGGGNGHYDPDEPRIPAGRPGGGQWTTGGNGVSSDSGNISADDIRSTLIDGFNNPSNLLASGQVAGDNLVPVSNVPANTAAAIQAAATAADNAAATIGSAASADSDAQPAAHILEDPEQYEGESFPNAKGRTECVVFAQQTGGAPLTGDWMAGDYISPSNPPPVGTWVATFDPDGNYHGHVGAFSRYDEDGNLYLYDQFNSKGEVSGWEYGVKPPGWHGHISNNPANYRIVLW